MAGSDNIIEQRRITLGPSKGGTVVVFNHLATTEHVVIDGLEKLKAGSKIDIAKLDGVAIAAQATSARDTSEHESQPPRRI